MYLHEIEEETSSFLAKTYDVIVVGAGHAGCEAALAASKMGAKTLLLTLSLDALANLPCNPSIGGTAKGQLVREVDALGGCMGKMADQCSIQNRMLNSSKGPAVQSPRAQIDRRMYQAKMLELLEDTPGLDLKQAEVVDILVEDLPKEEEEKEGQSLQIRGIVTKTKAYYLAKHVILCNGTYLDARIFIGNNHYSCGPDHIAPSLGLADNLKKHGLQLRRFKTGTPVRVNKNSVDFSRMEIQKADEERWTFSYAYEEFAENHLPKPQKLEQQNCYLVYTTDETKRVIHENLHRSPLFSGEIEGVGPRYCPSIEDKYVRFADKERHQIFIEPMGLQSKELYLQGMSSSLPEDVQEKMCQSLPGLEHAVIQRPAYAIEYECLDPLSLWADLSSRRIRGLYSAGQMNGTSGYEEAAAQGIMAGINAVLHLQGKEAFILGRDEAYIGVLIDDLVSKGTLEPYRMMTSRAEYRLLLRQDNADERLRPYGYQYGLVSEEEFQLSQKKLARIEAEVERLQKLKIRPLDEAAQTLIGLGFSPLHGGISVAELMCRPNFSYQDILALHLGDETLSPLLQKAVEIRLKYKGYIELEEKRIQRFKQLEEKFLPSDLDYHAISGLCMEARQKLSKFKPRSLGQASRISGVSPADISVLLVYLKMRNIKPNSRT